MNRSALYASVRQRASGVFGTSLSQAQVQGVEAILDEAKKCATSLFHLAAIFSEAYHETGGSMQPVIENLNYSARRMTEVWPKRFPAMIASARPYANNPQKLANKVYGGRMGNVGPNDCWLFRGRGLSQITGRANYEKFGIADNTILQVGTIVGMIVGGVAIYVNGQRDIDDMNEWRTGHEALYKEAMADREAAIARFDERIKTLEDTKIGRDSQIEALQGKTTALDQALSNTNNTLRDLSNKLNDVVADSRVSREILQRLEAGQRRGIERQ